MLGIILAVNLKGFYFSFTLGKILYIGISHGIGPVPGGIDSKTTKGTCTGYDPGGFKACLSGVSISNAKSIAFS